MIQNAATHVPDGRNAIVKLTALRSGRSRRTHRVSHTWAPTPRAVRRSGSRLADGSDGASIAVHRDRLPGRSTDTFERIV
jgi:hypothetical protein